MRSLFIAIFIISLCSISNKVLANDFNDKLLSLSDSYRTSILSKAIGHKCIGKRTYYDGMGTSGLSKDKAYWSVSCKNGTDYMIEVHPDGKTSVMECSLLQSMHAGECFSKF